MGEVLHRTVLVRIEPPITSWESFSTEYGGRLLKSFLWAGDCPLLGVSKEW